jgi:hypothetical protein
MDGVHSYLNAGASNPAPVLSPHELGGSAPAMLMGIPFNV